jgi:hypothetical protein
MTALRQGSVVVFSFPSHAWKAGSIFCQTNSPTHSPADGGHVCFVKALSARDGCPARLSGRPPDSSPFLRNIDDRSCRVSASISDSTTRDRGMRAGGFGYRQRPGVRRSDLPHPDTGERSRLCFAGVADRRCCFYSASDCLITDSLFLSSRLRFNSTWSAILGGCRRVL